MLESQDRKMKHFQKKRTFLVVVFEKK